MGADFYTAVPLPVMNVDSGVIMTNISSPPMAWSHYSATYTVPLGQNSTYFGFKAVSSSSSDLSKGNFLDTSAF